MPDLYEIGIASAAYLDYHRWTIFDSIIKLCVEPS